MLEQILHKAFLDLIQVKLGPSDIMGGWGDLLIQFQADQELSNETLTELEVRINGLGWLYKAGQDLGLFFFTKQTFEGGRIYLSATSGLPALERMQQIFQIVSDLKYLLQVPKIENLVAKVQELQAQKTE